MIRQIIASGSMVMMAAASVAWAGDCGKEKKVAGGACHKDGDKVADAGKAERVALTKDGGCEKPAVAVADRECLKACAGTWFNRLDANGDGNLNRAEFVGAMVGLTSSFGKGGKDASGGRVADMSSTAAWYLVQSSLIRQAVRDELTRLHDQIASRIELSGGSEGRDSPPMDHAEHGARMGRGCVFDTNADGHLNRTEANHAREVLSSIADTHAFEPWAAGFGYSLAKGACLESIAERLGSAEAYQGVSAMAGHDVHARDAGS